jgi:hypothetical protein
MKRFLFVTLMTTMLAACGKDDEKPANPAVLTNPTAPYLLYWDGTRMQVGAWGVVSQSNILFAKAGSTVAFTTISDYDTWDADDVLFNPTSAVYDDYDAIPLWDGTPGPDGLFSSPLYHNLGNVRAGRGDICKLAGLTKADIDAGVCDNGEFRLPTDDENWDAYPQQEEAGVVFPWIDTPVAGRWLAADPTAATFLPAAGYRMSSGEPNTVGSRGVYWSSMGGFCLFFDKEMINKEHSFAPPAGAAIRCVPQQ